MIQRHIFWVLLMAGMAGAQSPPVIGELFASETTAHGPVLLAGTGMSVASGSQLSAGKSVATLRLARGGEVRICPKSSASVTAASVHQELLFSMGVSSLEFDYPINDLADTLMTPDFKFMLAGPGVFHFAIGVTGQGDTCVKPLRGNTSSIIVTEAFGSGVYQVKSDESVIFQGGKLTARGPLVGECGCPAPPSPPPTQTATASGSAPPANDSVRTGVPQHDVTAALPPEKPGDIHMQVDAPLVFHGDRPVQESYTVARITFSSLPNAFLAQEQVEPTVLDSGKGRVSAATKTKKGFWGHVKGFFSSLFHK